MSDVFEVLGTDHRGVEGLLARLEAGGGDSGHLAEELVIEESKHEAAEEMYFWPAVREKVVGGDALADKALNQEQKGKEVLDQLRKCEPGEEEFRRIVATFAKAGREHISFEESEVWTRLRSVLTEQEAEELGSKIESAKEAGPTRPHPAGPDSPGELKTVGTATAMVDKVRDAATGRG
jgi:hemerythrin superfamily protein